MTALQIDTPASRAFHQRLRELRPKLHRYCARMAGSVFDGEDVLQEALGKAIEAFPHDGPPRNVEAWLFRIAHNTAVDFLRARRRQGEMFTSEDAAMVADPAPTPEDSAEDRGLAAAHLRAFMTLPVNQRSALILMDVLGYSLQEIAAMLHLTVPALKASLHRGRARLRVLAERIEEHPAAELGQAERNLLSRYVDRFNARDFEAIRSMLADEVRLDMVDKAPLAGVAEVAARYLHNYDLRADWRFSLAMVDGQPALLVRDPADASGAVRYFVQIACAGGRIVAIRDFRYAAYVTEGAEIRRLA